MRLADDPRVLAALTAIERQPRANAIRNRVVKLRQPRGPDAMRKLTRVVERFQSRRINRTFSRDIERDLPRSMPCFGTPRTTWYQSDKRDPADPHGEGRQGVWKTFYHHHPVASQRMGLRVYDLGVLGPANTDQRLMTEWPDGVGYLGNLQEVVYTDLYGTEQVYVPPSKFGLWVMPDANALMALPFKGRITNILVWFGGNLKVDWRGIEG